MTTEFIILTAAKIEEAFLPVIRQVVFPAQAGRFLYTVPNLGEDVAIRTPNVKEYSSHVKGGRGTVRFIDYESADQAIPADGGHVMLVNKVNESAGHAIALELKRIEREFAHSRREACDCALSFIRGFDFIPGQNEAPISSRNVGINPDVYFIPVHTAQLLHRNAYDRHFDLRTYGPNLPSGWYEKKPVATTLIYVTSPIKYKNQEFPEGAILQISSAGHAGKRSISFIHTTDLSDCYTALDEKPLVGKNGEILLPHYTINDKFEVQPHFETHIVTPEDVKGLDTVKATVESSRVYVRPNEKFFEGADRASFINEADHVNQGLAADDGVMICAFNYRTTNEDYKEKSAAFLSGIHKSHDTAENFADLIARISALYRTLDIGTPDIYTSTRTKMGKAGVPADLEGVHDKIEIKKAQVELLRIAATGQGVTFQRESMHRSSDQRYAGEVFIQITDRGNEKYEKIRAIHPLYVFASFSTLDGHELLVEDVPSYPLAAVKPVAPVANAEQSSLQYRAVIGR